jgi:tetratricopeptide (TPR) repeat protein
VNLASACIDIIAPITAWQVWLYPHPNPLPADCFTPAGFAVTVASTPFDIHLILIYNHTNGKIPGGISRMPGAPTHLPSLTIRLYLSDRYWAELRFAGGAGALEQAPASAPLEFDFAALRQAALRPVETGRLLAQALFTPKNLREYFLQCLAASAAAAGLRLRLLVDQSAQALHEQHWETLRDPDNQRFLALQGELVCSRFLDSHDWRPLELRPKGQLRALLVAANPAPTPDGLTLVDGSRLPPVDVAAELQRAQAALQGIPVLHALESRAEQVTLKRLCQRLGEGWDILYLAAHGALLRENPADPGSPRLPFLLLQDEQGAADLCQAGELIDFIHNLHPQKRPRLVVLASCQSGGALSALGPGLAAAGVPAVLASQADLNMETAATFTTRFFQELLEHGQVERAMAAARLLIHDRLDWWAPVLYTRLPDGRLFAEAPAQTPGLPALPPRGELPEPGSQQPGWRLPYHRNELFTGREKDLLHLAQSLFYTTQRQSAAVSGLGGVGKTQLAIELCYRYGCFTQAVHWINAASAADIPTQIAACGAAMHLQPWPDELPEQVTATLNAWRADPNRLVVLDNLEDPRALKHWLDQLGPVRLLLTTRRARLPRTLGISLYRLNYFKPPESRHLLRALAPRLKQSSTGELNDLAERLYHLPLTLHVAGLYLDLNAELSPADYLGKWHLAYQPLPEVLASDQPTEHELSLAATLLVSWEQLQPSQPTDILARRLFGAAGFCAPNTPIPSAVFSTLPVPTGGAAAPPADTALGLARLIDLGLLDASPAGPLIHPLLAEFARRQAGPERLPELVDVLARLSKAAYQTGAPANFLALLPHLRAAAEFCRSPQPESAALMLNQLGLLLQTMGDYPGARPCYQQALAIRREALGERHPDTAQSLNNLGRLLHDLGELPAARPYYEQALAIRRAVLGKRHPDTAISL